MARHPGRARSRGARRFWPAPRSPKGSARQAAALLVLELAYADPVLTPDDRALIAEHLQRPLGAGAARHAAVRRRPRRSGARASPTTPRRLRKRVGRAERLELVERMWTVAFADGAIGAHEARLMHLAAELLGLRAGRAGRGVAAPPGAAGPRDRRRACASAPRATSGSRASATSSRSSRGTARTRSRPTSRDLRRLAEFAASQGRARSRPGHPHAAARLRLPAQGSGPERRDDPARGLRHPHLLRLSGGRRPRRRPIRAIASSRPAAAGSCPTR